MSNVVIVYCHPYERSFNHAVMCTAVENMNRQGHRAHVIDLHAEGFNPAYDAEELRLFHDGNTHDPKAYIYLDMLRTADTAVFITPIWWNSIPGMLKGFIDKVMKEGEGLSHTIGRFGVQGELTNIKHTYVLTTSTSPTLFFRLFLGDGVSRIFINQTLKQLGMQHRRWINFGGITASTPQQRERYLARIATMKFE
ncbi:NAD(P)H-dependent oxidoreductase [Bifidobacterium sp.]|jgi:putative NADPH-quinone reductase|uniref:NAD(P)H-dependent oxidoreductase n=1 Tax=Bifidobacterium sp. TaxID=41200 RepID=UPI0025BF2B4D|nr:NAD(P)H-dependent oxidoreductase [Bifidobacterium sp.]MCH4208968.1 NAD(P)H-dependent oxidoreductase [Bifidobacterium sp.]MCI1224949.1 NAD(P)H-dependent oxidoreductase [Bifidobacterium sp.]